MYFCVSGHVFVLRVSMLVMYLCARGHVFVCWMSCISVLGISMLPLSTILIFHCVIVTTVWYFIAKKSQFKMHFNARYIISCIVHIFL
jgi:hypothetical protein